MTRSDNPSRRPLRLPAALAAAAMLTAGHPVVAQEQEEEAAKAKPAAESDSSAAVNTDALARVDGFLVFATNDNAEVAAERKVDIDEATRSKLEGRLRKVFPDWKEFHVIGKHTQKVFRQYESWVVPSKDIYLKIDSRGPADNGGINLHVQLWQDKKVLVKSDSVIRPGRPIVVAGPSWRRGRLIFVVKLKDPGDE